MQEELLDAHPDADIRVYAIVYEMVTDDAGARERVRPEELIEDPRAALLWDEDHDIGRWYENNVTKLGSSQEDRVEWDAWFLYHPDVKWNDRWGGPIGWGRTIYETRDRLRRRVEQNLSQP